MGIHDREYSRSDSSRSYVTGMGDGTSFVVGLIIVNMVVYFAQIVWTAPNREAYEPQLREILAQTPEEYHEEAERMFWRQVPRESVLTGWLQMDTQKVLFQGQVWRLFTYMFVHNDTPGRGHWHIIANMILLYLAGPAIVNLYGRREFLLFYIASGLMGAVASMALDVVVRDYTSCVGASGAISGILVLFACHWPQHKWLLFFVLPVPAVLMAIGSGLLDLIAVLHRLGGNDVGDNVGHAVHLGGMAFAYVYHRSQWRIEPLYLGFTRFRWKQSSLGTSLRARQRGLRVVRPEEDPAAREARVDELLQKISIHGQESLTAEELEFLKEDSRRKRARMGKG
jgi:membrane associated rhomboid family serine protease